jgi:uncharacterized delta-60 repeat protein
MAKGFGRLVTTLCAVGFVLTPNPAIAAAGSLDPTFSDDGKTTTPDVAFVVEIAEDVLVQDDGKIVVVGWSENSVTGKAETLVVRYLDDGTPDPDFGGGDGMVALPNAASTAGFSVALLSDQRIAIAGEVQSSGPGWDFAAFLLTTTGELDASFDADGVSVAVFGPGHDIAFGIAVDALDRVVLAGRVETTTSQRFGVVRMDSSGTLDATFSGDGMRTVRFRGGPAASDVAIQPNGRIVVAGHSNGEKRFALARLLTDGSLDSSFSDDGQTTTATGGDAHAVALQPDGKIVVAGQGRPGDDVDFTVARYRSKGKLDLTFGNDGIVTTDFDRDEDVAFDVAIQPSGKILAIGFASVNFNSRFGIVRYRTSGKRDLAFSGDGKVARIVGQAYGGTLDTTPRLVAVGPINGNMGTARFLLS